MIDHRGLLSRIRDIYVLLEKGLYLRPPSVSPLSLYRVKREAWSKAMFVLCQRITAFAAHSARE